MLACFPLLGLWRLTWPSTLNHAAVCASHRWVCRNSRNDNRTGGPENHNRGRRARHAGSVPTGECVPAALPRSSTKRTPEPHRGHVVTLCTVMDIAGLVCAGSKASAVVSIDGGCARGVREEDDGPRLSLCGVVLNSALAWRPFALLLWLPFDSCR
jgi:hypothetical protein